MIKTRKKYNSSFDYEKVNGSVNNVITIWIKFHSHLEIVKMNLANIYSWVFHSLKSSTIVKNGRCEYLLSIIVWSLLSLELFVE